MIKAIFFDIDGTLLSFKTHKVPSSTRMALKQLRENGVKLFIATGRPNLLINGLDDLDFDGYITLNGGHCFTASHQDIYKGVIPQEDIERLIQYSKSHAYPFVFVYGQTWFITHHDASVNEICKLIEIPAPPIAPIEQASGKEVLQIMGYLPEKEEDYLFNNVLTHCEPMRWHPLFTDITVKGTSKSRGIDEIIHYYGIDLKETMAFGDGGNDIPMLKHAGIGIAMGNASEQVQKVADYVTASVDDDGIWKALQHFGLL